MPFWRSWRPRWGYAVMYVAGLVSEQLATSMGALEVSHVAGIFVEDESCRHDYAEFGKVLTELKASRACDGPIVGEICNAIVEARDILTPRLPDLSAAISRFEQLIVAQRLDSFEVPWSAELSAQLCGRDVE